MTTTDTVYVYYPGHLGTAPVTELDSERHITWDKPVKRVPAKAARSLIRHSGFLQAITREEASARFGAAFDGLTGYQVVTYEPRGGEPAVDLVLLTPHLLRTLRAARPASAAAPADEPAAAPKKPKAKPAT